MKKVQIGNAILYRADSVEMLRAGAIPTIGAIVSDPPYGIGFQHSGMNNSGLRKADGTIVSSKKDAIYGDDAPFDPMPWIDLAPKARDQRGSLNSGAALILLWGADNYRTRIPDGGTMLAWDKNLGIGADDSFADCEWAWCGRKCKREVFRHLWKGLLRDEIGEDRKRKTTAMKRVHVSQKPIELMRWCIDKVRPIRGLPVLDPYMGSGSTGIAALSLGLTFIGIEIDNAHFDVACDRIRAFVESGGTGEQVPLKFAV